MEKQLHVSARGHRQFGSFGFARKKALQKAFFSSQKKKIQLDDSHVPKHVVVFPF
jgi:hypothetical protein